MTKFQENFSRPGKIDARTLYRAAARRLRNIVLVFQLACLAERTRTTTTSSTAAAARIIITIMIVVMMVMMMMLIRSRMAARW